MRPSSSIATLPSDVPAAPFQLTATLMEIGALPWPPPNPAAAAGVAISGALSPQPGRRGSSGSAAARPGFDRRWSRPGARDEGRAAQHERPASAKLDLIAVFSRGTNEIRNRDKMPKSSVFGSKSPVSGAARDAISPKGGDFQRTWRTISEGEDCMADGAVRCVLLSLSTCQPVDTHTVVDKPRLTHGGWRARLNPQNAVIFQAGRLDHSRSRSRVLGFEKGHGPKLPPIGTRLEYHMHLEF